MSNFSDRIHRSQNDSTGESTDKPLILGKTAPAPTVVSARPAPFVLGQGRQRSNDAAAARPTPFILKGAAAAPAAPAAREPFILGRSAAARPRSKDPNYFTAFGDDVSGPEQSRYDALSESDQATVLAMHLLGGEDAAPEMTDESLFARAEFFPFDAAFERVAPAAPHGLAAYVGVARTRRGRSRARGAFPREFAGEARNTLYASRYAGRYDAASALPTVLRARVRSTA